MEHRTDEKVRRKSEGIQNIVFFFTFLRYTVWDSVFLIPGLDNVQCEHAGSSMPNPKMFIPQYAHVHGRTEGCRSGPGTCFRKSSAYSQCRRSPHCCIEGQWDHRSIDFRGFRRHEAGFKKIAPDLGIDLEGGGLAHKREMSRLITAWTQARVAAEAKLQVDAVAKAHGVLTTVLPEDWTSMMTAFQVRKAYPRVEAAGPILL